MVQKQTYTTGNEILIKPETARRVGCLVKKPTSDEDGVYIVRAGTPLYAPTEATTTAAIDRTKPLSDEQGESTAVGVLYQDVIFSDGEETVNGTLVINGEVDYLKLDESVKTKVETAKADLPHIQFVKGRKD